MGQDNEISEDLDSKLANRLGQLEKKIEIEIGEGMRKEENGHDFHPSTTALIGASLVSLGYLWQEGSLIGVFVLGAVFSLFDIRKILGKDSTKAIELLKNHPAAYIIGGLAASIIFEGAGMPMPGIELGLVAALLQIPLG